MWGVVLLLFAALAASTAVPAPAPQAPTATPNKSAFVPAFDEIVVESSLRVRGRSGPTNPTQRQGRTKLLVVPTPGTPLNGTTTTGTPVNGTTTTSTTANTSESSAVAAAVVSSSDK